MFTIDISAMQVVVHQIIVCFMFKMHQTSFLRAIRAKKVWYWLKSPKRVQNQKNVNLLGSRVLESLKIQILVVQVVLDLKQWLIWVQDAQVGEM